MGRRGGDRDFDGCFYVVVAFECVEYLLWVVGWVGGLGLGGWVG